MPEGYDEAYGTYKYAFNETLKYINEEYQKVELIKLYEFYKPKVHVDFEKIKTIFSEIRDKIDT